MDESKRALRVAALSQRSSLSTPKYVSWSRLIQARVLESSFYRRAQAVAFYSSVQNEVSTDDIADHALRVGKKVFYPRFSPNQALFVLIQSAAELSPGTLGIREPSGETLLADHGDLDLLVLVPGLAFDIHGNRLGRGMGWYDRVLRSLGPRTTPVGLAYEFQMVDRVPTEPWDEKVKYIFTENRLIDCQRVPEQTTLVC
ncbi:MAG: 5-formyltetrahydrofolate cyclo-ligase [Candidatus Binatia bacterium]